MAGGRLARPVLIRERHAAMTSIALMKVAATFFLGGFFSLVTIINPPSALPLFTALSAPLNNAEQGLALMQIIDAVYASATSGKPVAI